jgi:hypothetical protein
MKKSGVGGGKRLLPRRGRREGDRINTKVPPLSLPCPPPPYQLFSPFLLCFQGRKHHAILLPGSLEFLKDFKIEFLKDFKINNTLPKTSFLSPASGRLFKKSRSVRN